MTAMAVIWRNKSGSKRYITPSNRPPRNVDVELAKKYDQELKIELKKLKSALSKKGFFEMQPGIERWYLLGEGLQFLENSELRKKCDPDFENTWRALYDHVPNLAPKSCIPKNKERAQGKRNHFYVCYRLAKFPWDEVKHLTWRMWNDIYMSFSNEMWKDGPRLLKWILAKSIGYSSKVDNTKMRRALIVARRTLGRRVAVGKDSTVLSQTELFSLLDNELKNLNFVSTR